MNRVWAERRLVADLQNAALCSAFTKGARVTDFMVDPVAKAAAGISVGDVSRPGKSPGRIISREEREAKRGKRPRPKLKEFIEFTE